MSFQAYIEYAFPAYDCGKISGNITSKLTLSFIQPFQLLHMRGCQIQTTPQKKLLQVDQGSGSVPTPHAASPHGEIHFHTPRTVRSSIPMTLGQTEQMGRTTRMARMQAMRQFWLSPQMIQLRATLTRMVSVLPPIWT